METYRFNIYELSHRQCDTFKLQSKSWLDYYVENEFFNNYSLRYDIPEREITKRVAFCDALFNRVGPKREHTKKVKWYETIYNVKVEKIKHTYPSYNLKVGFSVKCTPREAWIIGEALKSMYDGKVTYKRKGN